MKKMLMMLIGVGLFVGATGCSSLYNITAPVAQSALESVVESKIDSAVDDNKITEAYAETLKAKAQTLIDQLFAQLEELCTVSEEGDVDALGAAIDTPVTAEAAK